MTTKNRNPLGLMQGGKKRPPVDQQVLRLEAVIEKQRQIIEGLANEYTTIKTTLNSLMRANNSASAVIAAIEEHLDEVAPSWDKGKRKVIEDRLTKLERRKVIWTKSANRNLEKSEIVLLAEELWGIAIDVGTAPADAGKVLQLYLQAGRIDLAETVISEIREQKIELSSDVNEVVEMFESRIAEARKKSLEQETAEPPAPGAA